MKNKQKVWIRGVEGRGNEVLRALKKLGGKLRLKPGFSIAGSGENPNYIYTMTHEGIICAIIANNDFGKIIMDCLREINLPERWKDGTVLFSPLHRIFAVYTEEDNSLSYVNARFVLSDNEIEYNCCIRKRDYRIANKKERKKFSEWLHKHGKDWDAEKKQLVDWRWKPKMYKKYWAISTNSEVIGYEWDNDSFDKKLFDFGNCFRTEDEANAAAERVKKALEGIKYEKDS